MMNARRIYLTFRRHAVDVAAKHELPVDEALRALARTASQCNPNLVDFEIARHVRAEIEESVVQPKRARSRFRETG